MLLAAPGRLVHLRYALICHAGERQHIGVTENGRDEGVGGRGTGHPSIASLRGGEGIPRITAPRYSAESAKRRGRI